MPAPAFTLDITFDAGRADAWSPSRHGHKPADDLLDPTQGANETLSVVDEGDEVLIDFTDVPNADEPANFSALLAFVRRVADLETWEDRLRREYADGSDDGSLHGYSFEDYARSADKDLVYLEGQDEAVEKLVALARAILAAP